MKKKMTCIACPQGCQLEVEVEGGYVVSVAGAKCKKGEPYARQEIENPQRILTTTVLTQGLEMKTAPVRTSAPIPRDKLFPAMREIEKVRLKRKAKVGDVVIKDLLGTGADLMTTREVF